MDSLAGEGEDYREGGGVIRANAPRLSVLFATRCRNGSHPMFARDIRAAFGASDLKVGGFRETEGPRASRLNDWNTDALVLARRTSIAADEAYIVRHTDPGVVRFA